MHELLQRQLEKYIDSTGSIPEDWQPFLDAVDRAYHETEEYREQVEEQSSAMLDIIQSVALGDLDVEVDVPEGAEILSELAVGLEMMIDDLRATMGEQEASRKELEQRALQLATAAQVSHAATAILDPQELIQQVVDLARQRFDLYYAGLFLVDRTGEWTDDEPGKWAVLRAGTGEAGQKMIADGHRLEVGGDSMIGQCIATRQARITLYAGEEQVRFRNPHLPETRSEMALPLTSRGVVLGAMTVQSEEEAAFSDEDIAVLQTMADQVANAIENARLFQESERRERQAQTLYEAAQMVSGLSASLEENLQGFFERLESLGDFDRWWVPVLQEDGETMIGLAGRWENVSDEDMQRRIILAEESRNPVVIAVRNQETVIVNNPETDERLSDLPDEIRRALGKYVTAPIFIGDEVVGAVSIGRPATGRNIHKDDVELVRALASQISIAIENNRLFNQTERALVETEALYRAGRAINQLTDRDEMLQHLANVVVDQLGYASAWVALVEEKGQALKGIAEVGIDTTDESIHRELVLDADTRNPSIQAAMNGNTIIVNDASSDERSADLEEEVRAYLGRIAAVPIVTGTRVVGVLAVNRPTNTPEITQREADLLEAIADQAGIAIQNVNLFEQTQLALKEISCLSDIGRKVNETPPLDDFLHWVADRIPPAMKHDDVCVAAIKFEDEVYGVPEALESPHQIVGTLQVGGETVGRVTIAYTEERDFIDEESGLIGGIVRRVSSYIENRRLFEQTQANLAETEILYRTSQAVGRSQSTRELLESLEKFAEFLDMTSISYREIAARDANGLPIRINVYPHSLTEEGWIFHDPVYNVPISGPAAKALVDNPKQIVIFRDAEDLDSPMPDRVRENMLQTGHRGALTVGLSARDELVGYLSFVSPIPLDISERYTNVIIPTLADQIAIILDNIQLLDQTERALEETRSLYETSRAIAAAGAAPQILDALVESASPREPDRCALVIFNEHDPETTPDHMELVAAWQRNGESNRNARRHYRMADMPSALIWEKENIVIINDIASDERLPAERRTFLMETLGMQAAVIVPLVARGRWIGVYTIEFSEPQDIDKDDVENYLAIAGQAALAIQNQRQLERIESRARQEQMLREIIARVRGNDPETVARAAVRALGNALNRPTFIRLGSAEELTRSPGSESANGDERGPEGGE